MTRMAGTLHEDVCTFMVNCRSFLLKRINISDKTCSEDQITHFMCSNFYFSENRAVYEIMWEKLIEPDRPRMTMWRMRIACWITKTTNTHSEYITLIAFPLKIVPFMR